MGAGFYLFGGLASAVEKCFVCDLMDVNNRDANQADVIPTPQPNRRINDAFEKISRQERRMASSA
jgi:hypothetical protein